MIIFATARDAITASWEMATIIWPWLFVFAVIVCVLIAVLTRN